VTLLTIHEATQWATKYLNRDISTSNISYLVQYGKVKKYGENGSTRINLDDLKCYYKSFQGKRELDWKKRLGNDLNWDLSFSHLREKDTTKHVHRLHPYKGKFIPQLVGYFLDTHRDDFKKNAYFKQGDIILDPFLGSGTTIIQANELGMHGIGIDISHFNCMISECKVQKYDMKQLSNAIEVMTATISAFEEDCKVKEFENELLDELFKFNDKYFPNPQFKYDVNQGGINEEQHGKEKEAEFLPMYNALLKKYGIKTYQKNKQSFLDKWYADNARKEINCIFEIVKKEKDRNIKELLAIILSRTIRSCRATRHSDLATLKEPQFTTYYCHKHKKICKPIFSIKKMLNRYAYDTFKRIEEFEKLKTGAFYAVIPGDSRAVDIFSEVKRINPKFSPLIKEQKIRGIFSSPPYVGQIDYHEQHAYAYDLFGFERKDNLEIGPLFSGQGCRAKESYVQGISDVLINCKKFMVDDFDVFLVANDKWNLYPEIAEESGMKIVNRFKRPVLNRTERDRNPYSEIIFHMKNVV